MLTNPQARNFKVETVELTENGVRLAVTNELGIHAVNVDLSIATLANLFDTMGMAKHALAQTAKTVTPGSILSQ